MEVLSSTGHFITTDSRFQAVETAGEYPSSSAVTAENVTPGEQFFDLEGLVQHSLFANEDWLTCRRREIGTTSAEEPLTDEPLAAAVPRSKSPVGIAPHHSYVFEGVHFAVEHRTRVRRCSSSGCDVRLAYDVIGDPAKPKVIVIGGLMATMLHYSDHFCVMLAKKGVCVVRFDNRDAGKSTHMWSRGMPSPLHLCLPPSMWGSKPAYSLYDMALDVIGLLDLLQINRAHLIGTSMGGMITQYLLRHHGDRVLSATFIVSSTSAPHLPMTPPRTIWKLATLPKTGTLGSLVEFFRQTMRYLLTADRYCERWIGRTVDNATVRGRFVPSPEGVAPAARQFVAISGSGDRTAMAQEVAVLHPDIPMLVLHGAHDNVLPVAHGAALASVLGSNATFSVLSDTSHMVTDDDYDIITEKLDRYVFGVQ